MSEEKKSTFLSKMRVICKCKNIRFATIQKAIAGGARTYEQVSLRTGSNTGECQGEGCREAIELMIAEAWGRR